MYLLDVFLIAAIVALWIRADRLAERLDRAQDNLATLQEDLVDLRPTLVTDGSAAPSMAAISAEPLEFAEPLAASGEVPMAHPETEHEPAVKHSWRQSPTRAAWLAEAAKRVEATPEIAEPLVPEPAGPSLAHRLFLRLGLAPSAEGEVISRAAIEAWLEGRMLAVVGGIALLLGAVFFLSLAFSRGWITEPMRVLIGLAAGVGLLILGELAFSKLRGILGHVLVAIGLAIVSLALLAATRLYGLVPVEWGLAGAFVAAVAAAAIAIRHDSQLVAGFGLVAVLAAPPVLGASPTLVTLLFVAVTLVGSTGVALFRTWDWLPPLAFLLAAPQLASYVSGDAPVIQALIAVVGFWLVNTIAAGGEEIRHATDRLRTTTVTLLLANAAFTIWAGFTVLAGPDETWRGSFLAGLAVAYVALGLVFLARNGDRHPFGLIVTATGVATMTMAVPVQFGGPPVPIAWAAEAVALAWVASLRRHPYSAAVAVLLGILAIGHLLGIEYPAWDLRDGLGRTWPFVGAEGLTYGFMMAGLGVAAVAVPIAWIRAAFFVVAGLVTLYVLPFELSGTPLVAAWAALATISVALFTRVVGPAIRSDFVEDRTGALGLPSAIKPVVAIVVASLSRVVRPAVIGTAVLAGWASITHLVAIEYPPDQLLDAQTGVPFLGLAGLAFAIVIAMLGATGLLVGHAAIRIGLATLGGLLALYVFPFELSGPSLVWAWAALATAAILVQIRVDSADPRALIPDRATRSLVRPAIGIFGVLAGGAVLGHLIVEDFPIDRLGQGILSSFPYLGPEGLALAAALAALACIGWFVPIRALRLGTVAIGLGLLAYSVTFEIDRPHVMLAWGGLTVLAIAVVRRVARIDLLPVPGASLLTTIGERAPFGAAAFASALLVVQGLWYAGVEPFVRHVIGQLVVSDIATPFLDVRSYALAIIVATALGAGVAWRGTTARLVGCVAAAAVAAWLLPFEVRPGYAISGWAALALAGAWAIRLVPAGRVLIGAPALALTALASVVALVVVARPDRLMVDAATVIQGLPLLTDATVALGALAAGLGVASYLHRSDPLSRWGFLAAGVVGVYLLSVGLVDQFQVQVGSRPLEELEKEAQVGLSVLWSALGLLGFAAGLRLHRPPIRLSGLALLGLASVKVFLVDLASLDVAYRVLSLVALGVLLLVSAFVYARMQHPHPPTSPKPA